jgi:hypothetical protein
MARRSPARVRADTWYPSLAALRGVPGLSPRGVAAVVRLERTRFWPGAVAEALAALSRFVRDPVCLLWDSRYGCGMLGCCPDPAEIRGILDAVTQVLPPKDAGLIRRRVAALDELW